MNGTGPSAIELNSVTVACRERRLLDVLSLRIPSGVVAGLVGPNGAGKTTTFRVLTGLVRPHSGTVCVLGQALPTQADVVRRQLGVVPERDGLYDDMRVGDLLIHVARLQRPADPAWQRARVEAVLAELDLRARREDWCGTLSTGLRRRVARARAILPAPPLLLLDEPTSGLDLVSRDAFYTWLARQRAEAVPTTVVLATHNTIEVARLCNFFVVLHDGRQRFCGPREALCDRPTDPAALEAAFLRLLRS